MYVQSGVRTTRLSGLLEQWFIRAFRVLHEQMQLQEKTDDDGLALKVSRRISKIVHVNPRPTHTKVPPLVFPTVRKVLINLCQHALIRNEATRPTTGARVRIYLWGLFERRMGNVRASNMLARLPKAISVLCLPRQSRKDSSSSR